MKKFDYKIFNVNHKFTVLGVPYEPKNLSK